MERATLFIGTAGWSIPRAHAERCPGEGTHLRRYSRIFPCAEINSSFHRPHAAWTYASWAASTPAAFRFAVKVPKQITHVERLSAGPATLDRFLDESASLGEKRGPLLIQLPPSLVFEAQVARRFFDLLRSRHAGPVVCEPRHDSWFTEGEALLADYQIARVAADPPRVAGADRPGGWPGLTYFRLHGSPRTYWSSYGADRLDALAAQLRRVEGEAWCIFDNTASGAAFANAWDLQAAVHT